jgi:gliding motility-associated-like protein
MPGIYRVTLAVTNQYGCVDTAETNIVIKVPEHIYIPSAFSPNGDNKNDYFSVKAQNINAMSVMIYNRWGEQIYNSADPLFMWDGTYRGSPAQEEVYVYLIKAVGFHGKQIDVTGSVTLLR